MGMREESMRLSIKAKLLGGFMVTVLLLAGIFSVAYIGLENAAKDEKTVFTQTQEDFQWAQMRAAINRQISYMLAYGLTTKDSWIGLREQQAGLAQECVVALDPLISPERRAMYENIVQEKQAVEEVIVRLMTVYKEQGIEAGNAMLGELAKVNNKLTEDIGYANSTSHTNALAADAAVTVSKDRFILIMAGIAVLAVVIAVFLGLWISNNISSGIKKLNKALKTIASGDLTHSIKIKSKDELGDMANSYNDMQKQLSKLVSQLKGNANQLSAASEQLSTAAKQSSEATQQVATSSQQMAKGAQEQSTNTQETSKSITHLSEAIDQLARGSSQQSEGVSQAVAAISQVANTLTEVADNADKAALGAKQAAESAQAGSENARQTLSGMDKIKTSTSEVAKKIEELGAHSAEIGKIVAVIDDIAAQTNLLALNAAIEAARAGDQGRGFAVVSDEVRKLAERTATATKEITDLITNVQKGVKEATLVMDGGNTAVAEGYNLAVKAGQSLDQILKASLQVNTQISQISAKTQQVNIAANELVKVIDSVGNITEANTAAAQQMTGAAAQVSKSVETVAGIAEENSAATQEVSASAEEMSAQVQEIVASSQILKDMAVILEESVATFKVEAAAPTLEHSK
jgi:methyl-accepting chemotaxis protein